MAPGQAVPVSVSVNGIPAVSACPGQALNVTAAGGTGIPLPGEQGPTVPVAAGLCGYVYSSYRTPMLSTALPSTANPANVTLWGALLGGAGAANYSATIGGLPAAVLAVTSSNSTSQKVTLSVPTLPAGTWPVLLTVSGMGYARSPLLSASPAITVANTVTATSAAAQNSFWGGVVLSVTGTGFVPTANGSATAGQSMKITYASGGPPSATWTASVINATTTSMNVVISRWFSASVTPVRWMAGEMSPSCPYLIILFLPPVLCLT